MKTEVIKLITKTSSGAEVDRKETEIYAEKKSVRQSEFYKAQQVGHNPQIMLVVDALDFESAEVDGTSASEVEYNEKHYVILRTYEPGSDVELICEVM